MLRTLTVCLVGERERQNSSEIFQFVQVQRLANMERAASSHLRTVEQTYPHTQSNLQHACSRVIRLYMMAVGGGVILQHRCVVCGKGWVKWLSAHQKKNAGTRCCYSACTHTNSVKKEEVLWPSGVAIYSLKYVGNVTAGTLRNESTHASADADVAQTHTSRQCCTISSVCVHAGCILCRKKTYAREVFMFAFGIWPSSKRGRVMRNSSEKCEQHFG